MGIVDILNGWVSDIYLQRLKDRRIDFPILDITNMLKGLNRVGIRLTLILL